MKASQQPPCIADLCLHMPTAMTTKETLNIARTSVGGSTTVARNVITPQTLTVKSITQISPGISPNLSSGLHRTNSSFAAQKSNQVKLQLRAYPLLFKPKQNRLYISIKLLAR